MHKRSIAPSPYFRFSLGQWIVLFLLAGLGFFSSNPKLTPFCMLFFPFLVTILWRRAEPPILFFVVAIQWLEVTMKVFHANGFGISVNQLFMEYFPEPIEVEQAIQLGLIGLLILAFGMRIGTWRLPTLENQRLQQDASTFSLKKVWGGYLIAFFISLSLLGLAKVLPLFKQILFTLANFRWVMFFILAYLVLYKKQGRLFLTLATLFEIIVGFTGYFSKFTYVTFVLFLAVSAVGYRPRLGNIVKAILVIVFAVFLASFWSSIKAEYRDFLSGGEKAQIIVVPVTARFEKLSELALRFRGEDLKRGFESLLFRIEYVDFFAYVLNYVPNIVPHEGGELWMKAVKHVLMPRLFFPGKAQLGSDSEITMKYTGLWLAGEESGTSISVGYMAESYIDFGIPGMLIPIFLLGILWGFIFRFLVTKTRPRIFGYALSIVVLIDTLGFGSNNAKLLGGVITGLIVMTFVSKFVVPHFYRTLLPSHH